MLFLSALAIFINMTYLFFGFSDTFYLATSLSGCSASRWSMIAVTLCVLPTLYRRLGLRRVVCFFLRPRLRLRCNFICLHPCTATTSLSRFFRAVSAMYGDYVGEFFAHHRFRMQLWLHHGSAITILPRFFILAGLPGNSLSVSYKNLKNDRSSCRRCVVVMLMLIFFLRHFGANFSSVVMLLFLFFLFFVLTVVVVHSTWHIHSCRDVVPFCC